MSNNLYLLEKNLSEMTLEEWITFMQDDDILSYKFNNINIPKSLSKFGTLKNNFPTFELFMDCLKCRFYDSYLEKIKNYLKQFYDTYQNTYMSKSFVTDKLYKFIIGKRYHKTIIIQQLIFYIRKGASSLEEATELMHKNCKGNSPMSIERYLKKGYSKEEAKNFISKEASYRNKGIYRNLRKLNLSEEDINKKVSEIRGTNSLLSVKHYLNKGYTENEAKVLVKNKVREISATCSEYWEKKGYSKEESFKIRKERLDSINPMLINTWINKGYSEKEAEELVSKYAKKNKYAGPFGGYYAHLLFDYLYKKILFSFSDNITVLQYGFLNNEFKMIVPKDNPFYSFRKSIKLDFYFETKDGFKINIEYDSDKKHQNKELDKNRDIFIKSYGIVVFRVKESLLGRRTTNVEKTLENIFEKIKRIYYENKKNS